MSVRSYVSITFSSLALLMVSVSYADSGGETIDALQAEHAQLIQQGVDNGTLTQSEIAVLRKQQALINNREKVLRKDGLERDEIYELMDMLDAAEAQIREMLKNAERVAPTPAPPVTPVRPPVVPKSVESAQGGVSVTGRRPPVSYRNPCAGSDVRVPLISKPNPNCNVRDQRDTDHRLPSAPVKMPKIVPPPRTGQVKPQ